MDYLVLLMDEDEREAFATFGPYTLVDAEALADLINNAIAAGLDYMTEGNYAEVVQILGAPTTMADVEKALMGS